MRRPPRWTFGSAALLAASLTACDMPQPAPAPTEAVQRALNGQTNFSTDDHPCADTLKPAIIAAFTRAADQVFNSGPLTACLKNAVTSGAADNEPETIVADLAEDMPTTVHCDNLPAGVAAHAPIAIDHEDVTFDNNFVQTATVSQLAGVLLHEISHNKGYSHHDTVRDPSAASTFEYANTVPEQVRACSTSARPDFNGSPNGFPRSALTAEATLAPVGVDATTPQLDIFCPSNRIAKGVIGRMGSGGTMTAMGLTCMTPGSDSGLLDTTVRGGTDGTPFRIQCGAGEVLIGLEQFQDPLTTFLRARCASESSVRAQSPVLVLRDTVGSQSPTGHFTLRQCPDGMSVKGVRLHTGSVVARTQLDCIDLIDSSVAMQGLMGTLGAPGTGVAFLERCAGRAGLAGVQVGIGTGVHRISAECDSLYTFCNAGICFEGRLLQRHALPGHGSWDGNAVTDRCSSSSVLVGLNALVTAATGQLSAVQGDPPPVSWTPQNARVCARSDPWRSGNDERSMPSSRPRRCACAEWATGASGRWRRIWT